MGTPLRIQWNGRGVFPRVAGGPRLIPRGLRAAHCDTGR